MELIFLLYHELPEAST